MRECLLVTGGAGFIGSCFVRDWFAVSTERIVNLDKLTYAGCLESLAAARTDPRHVFVEGDICNGDLIRFLLNQYQPRAIIHFAAESHVDRSIDGPDAFLHTNITGTHELLKAAVVYWRQQPEVERDRFRFLYVSTDEIYGTAGPDEFFTEETNIRPNSPYSATKAAAGHLVRAYQHTFGLPTVTTSCSNNYGPYQFPEKMLPLMILNAMEGRPLPVYGDGQHQRDWLHVADHCSGIRLALDKGALGETYNIGGEGARHNLDVVHLVCDTVDRLCGPLPHGPCRGLIQFVKDRPGHDRRYAIDPSKIRTQLGWKAQYDFPSGLEQTVRWYIDNKDWLQVTRAKYDRQRLGTGR
jgi:dTDP-glucose 4,6-dehydratase